MTVESLPESPVLNRAIVDAHWTEIVARLPEHLPPPIRNARCVSGPVLIVHLRDGSEIDYECEMPASIRGVRNYMISVVQNPTSRTLRAEELCREAVPNAGRLVSSAPTTVGDIRNITIGTTAPTPKQTFPTRDARDFGAWCWTRVSGNNFDVYKVTPGVEAVLAVHLLDFNPRDAHGAPAIP